MQPSDLVKLDVLLAGDTVDALSMVVHRDKAYEMGRTLTEKLRKRRSRASSTTCRSRPRSARTSIARETVKAFRKDVIAKCYGGDITRKRKLLEKQKEGKKRMKQVGRVEVPAGGVPGGARARRLSAPRAQPALRGAPRESGGDARARPGGRPAGRARSRAMRVLFVCLGNICRSPTAEGVMRALVREAGSRAADRARLGRDRRLARRAARPTSARRPRRPAAASRSRARRGRCEPRTSTTSTCSLAMDRENLRRAAPPGAGRRRRARRCGCCASSTRRARGRATSTCPIRTTARATASSACSTCVAGGCAGCSPRSARARSREPAPAGRARERAAGRRRGHQRRLRGRRSPTAARRS